jgi:predicted flap endonuclease-1-like 5' DNA nuclease
MRRTVDNSKTTAELRQGARNYLTELRRQRSELNVPRGQGIIPSAARVPSTKPLGGSVAKPVEAKFSRAPTMNAVVRETADVQAASQGKKRGDAISRLQGISGKSNPSNLAKPAEAPAPAAKRVQRLRRTVKPAPIGVPPVDDNVVVTDIEVIAVAAPVEVRPPNQSESDYKAWLVGRAVERELAREERAKALEARRVARGAATLARVAGAQEHRKLRTVKRAELREAAVARVRPASLARPVSSVSDIRRERKAVRIAALEAAAIARAAAAETEAAKAKLADDKARAREAARAAAAARKAEHRAAVEKAEADRLAQEAAVKAKIEAAAQRRAEMAAKRKAEAAARLEAEAKRLADEDAEKRKAEAAEKRRAQAAAKREAQEKSRLAADAERLAQEDAARRKAEAVAKRRADAAAKRAAARALKAQQAAVAIETIVSAEPEPAAPVIDEDLGSQDIDVAAVIAQFSAPASEPIVDDIDVAEEIAEIAIAVAAPAPIDLSVIPNLGPAMRNRLHQLGVTTVADLAAIDPESLRRLLGPISALANIDRWIADAQAMLSEEKLAA